MNRFVRTLLSATPITREEEVELARRARSGDAEARRDLITSGLRAVALRACSLGFRGDELSDAVQSGAVGLIRAVDRFDPDRGVRLATYSWQWVTAEMRRWDEPTVAWDDAFDMVAAETPDVSDDPLSGLSEIESDVLRMRFGTADPLRRQQSRQEVGEGLGLTVSQVRTIEGKAMRQLRQGLASVVHRAPQ